MDKFLFKNNLNTLLSTNIDENATIIAVSTGTGVLFPDPDNSKNEYFTITLSADSNDDNTEICWVTSKDGDHFTVLRGQENTVARKWSQGAIISNRITAVALNQIKDKANQSDVDKAIGNIDFSPYYEKAGDTLTGAMHTNGNYLWGGRDKTYLVGQDNNWFIKKSDGVALISFENGSITLNGQYSSLTANAVWTNTITSKNGDNVTFSNSVVANGRVQVNNNDLLISSNIARPDIGEKRQTKSIALGFDGSDDSCSYIYSEELVGTSNRLVFLVQGGENKYYYVFDNFGTFFGKAINVEKSISADTLSVNQATVQDGSVIIQSNNTTADGNGYIHGNSIYLNLQRRGVSGSIYLQELPGQETALIFQASGGGKTNGISINNDGKLNVDVIQTNTITSKNGDNVTFSNSVVANGRVQVNNNDLLISSNIARPDIGEKRQTKSIALGFDGSDDSCSYIYSEELVGTSNRLVFLVQGGENKYYYVFDNFGTIYAENFNGTALQAKYADLAEYYISDQKYEPGTIVKIGGINEITTASKGGYFMGIISTSPGLKINEEIKDHPLALLVALTGRVPVKVLGNIQKGDPITLSEIDGIAIKAQPFENIIGFSLEDKATEDIFLVECSVKSIGVC